MKANTLNLMDESFNEEAYFDAELNDLARQLHEKCAARNIPLVCFIAYSNNSTDHGNHYGMCKTVHLPGPGRNPVTFVAASEIMGGDIGKGIEAAEFVRRMTVSEWLCKDEAKH